MREARAKLGWWVGSGMREGSRPEYVMPPAQVGVGTTPQYISCPEVIALPWESAL